MLKYITIFGIIIDILVCIFFTVRLIKKYREDKTNIFLKYFIGIFISFAVFLFMAMFYVPGYFIEMDTTIFRVLFGIGFFALYSIAAFSASVFSLLNFPRMSSRIIFFTYILLGIITSVIVGVSSNPIILSKGSGSLGVNIAQTMITVVPIVVAFLATFVTFLGLAVKSSKNRIKNVLLASAFLLWIIGGPLHSQFDNVKLMITADALVFFGFLLSFIALIQKPKQKTIS